MINDGGQFCSLINKLQLSRADVKRLMLKVPVMDWTLFSDSCGGAFSNNFPSKGEVEKKTCSAHKTVRDWDS